MPTYDYYCQSNGRTVEVQHKMSEKLATWGELCQRAGIPPGGTPHSAVIERLATGGNIIGSAAGSARTAAEPCEMGTACCGGGCALQ